ncbi:MAG: hypothetical protein OXC19_18185, partial [Bryobacterales bacterium]|nr:hypothetical protein [Bryobacterales bacterium]
HGGREAAESFFLGGMTGAMRQLCEQAHPGFPVTIYYAFKQAEQKGDAGVSSTGWETFLDAAIRSGFSISGTWPMRTELGNRMVGMGTNALASSIVLVCRRRASDAPVGTRREFLADLRADLPQALRLLQTGNIAPVDLAQAAIGPGMAVYTRYARSERHNAAEYASLRHILVVASQFLRARTCGRAAQVCPVIRFRFRDQCVARPKPAPPMGGATGKSVRSRA